MITDYRLQNLFKKADVQGPGAANHDGAAGKSYGVLICFIASCREFAQSSIWPLTGVPNHFSLPGLGQLRRSASGTVLHFQRTVCATDCM
jgi:hypothetical protein